MTKRLVDYFFVDTMLLGNKSYTNGKPDYFPFQCAAFVRNMMRMSSRAEYVGLQPYKMGQLQFLLIYFSLTHQRLHSCFVLLI